MFQVISDIIVNPNIRIEVGIEGCLEMVGVSLSIWGRLTPEDPWEPVMQPFYVSEDAVKALVESLVSASKVSNSINDSISRCSANSEHLPKSNE